MDFLKISMGLCFLLLLLQSSCVNIPQTTEVPVLPAGKLPGVQPNAPAASAKSLPEIVNCQRTSADILTLGKKANTSRILDNSCFIRDWNLVGPFRFKSLEENNSELIHKSFCNVEKYSAIAANFSNKLTANIHFNPEKNLGEINLNLFYSKSPSPAAAYAFCILNCEKDMDDLTLYVGGSSYLKIWLNDKLLYTFNRKSRKNAWEHDILKNITLKQGKNILLVKSLDVGKGWTFHVRFADKNDSPLRFKNDKYATEKK